MIRYEKLRLRDQLIKPTDELLAEVLGESYKAYSAFQKGLNTIELENVWQYYPCFATKAWMSRGVYKWTTMRGANKEKNIFWLSVWDGYFNVTVWFKGGNRDEILKANISDETKELIRSAKTFGPKMNTFPVEFEIIDKEQFAALFELIRCKKRLEA